MNRDWLSDIITVNEAVRAEFGVPIGRNEWLNFATVGDLHEHVAFELGARSDAARSEHWPRVAAVVASATGFPADRIRPGTTFDEAFGR